MYAIAIYLWTLIAFGLGVVVGFLICLIKEK